MLCLKDYFPILLQVDVTTRCNMLCAHCRVEGKIKQTEELTFDEWKKILDPIFENSPRKIQWVTIGGGEPTLYEDLLPLISYLRDKTDIILLMTNGIIIVRNPEFLDELTRNGLNRIQISLESYRQEVHENIRGIGSYGYAVNAIKMCQGKIDVAVRMTLNDLNKKDYVETIKFAKSLEAVEFNIRKIISVGNAKEFFTINCVTPEEYSDILQSMPKLEEELDIFINSEEPLRYLYNKKFNNLIEKEGKLSRGCPVGISYAYINPAGKMRSCSNIYEIIGDLKNGDSFWDIWNHHNWMQRLRTRDFENCISCEYKNICGGCRAMALAYTKNYWGKDPNCLTCVLH